MERRFFNRNEISEKLTSGEYHLKHRKLLRSGVWQHFARVYNGDQPLNYTCCMHCHQ
uniref:Uncharacterized protein n=1 Tax=Romanomermis culicivorax TaxID=13658 RepID=A0A915L6R1_ROMCU